MQFIPNSPSPQRNQLQLILCHENFNLSSKTLQLPQHVSSTNESSGLLVRVLHNHGTVMLSPHSAPLPSSPPATPAPHRAFRDHQR